MSSPVISEDAGALRLSRFLPQSAAASAFAIFALAFATIAGALIFERLGFPPCDLCLEQRTAYYVGVPLAALVFLLARAGFSSLLVRVGLGALALIFAVNMVLAIYHSGVEAGLWQGPTACTGSGAGVAGGGDLLKQLETVKVVRCDAVNLRVFGLSLANWNILISAALAALGARAASRQ
jgi:disulfide bond formation protein DsbB